MVLGDSGSGKSVLLLPAKIVGASYIEAADIGTTLEDASGAGIHMKVDNLSSRRRPPGAPASDGKFQPRTRLFVVSAERMLPWQNPTKDKKMATKKQYGRSAPLSRD